MKAVVIVSDPKYFCQVSGAKVLIFPIEAIMISQFLILGVMLFLKLKDYKSPLWVERDL